MVTADSHASSLARLALIGLGTAFAWIVLSLLLGLGSTQASAQAGDDESGPGAVTSLLDETVTGVTGTVGGVVSTATDVVGGVAEVVPAPAQAPVQEIVSSVGEAVTAVAEPVQAVVDSGVVSTVVAPVVDLVQQTPVVGELAGRIGLDRAVTDLGGTVDGALSGTVSTLTGAGTDLATPPSPGVDRPRQPASDDLTDAAVPSAAADVSTTAAAGEPKVTQTALATTRGGVAHSVVLATMPRASTTAVTSTALHPPDDRLAPGGLSSPAISSGPGGAGPGAWALVAFAPLAAHRAWMRRAGPDDEDVPAAPPGSTDVSPD